MDVRKILIAAVWVASVLGAGPVANAAELRGVNYKDVTLFAAPPKAGVNYGMSILSADKALTNIQKALDLLYRKSSFSRTAIETLRENGKIFVVYDPNFPKKGKGPVGLMAAAFFPDYFEEHGRGPGGEAFLAIVTRYGIKWPTPELAAVLAHELVGHAMQKLLGRFGFIRTLDLECEAWLYQEKVLQDLGVDKRAREIVVFRQNLEYHYCSDFKSYMRKRDPASVKLWDVLNPDVPRLLAIFEGYVKDLSAKGVSGKAIKAAKKDQSEKRLRRIKEKGSPEEQLAVGLAFRNGFDGLKDQVKAAKWFALAANNGLKQAQLELALSYDKGLGVTANKAKAVAWFRKAAEAGVGRAQRSLGGAYEKGHGVRKDLVQAYKWYALAAKQETKGAAKRRDNLARRMTAAQKSQARELVKQWKPNKS